MVWFFAAAFAHDHVFPQHVYDPVSRVDQWALADGMWLAPLEAPAGGGSRVAARIEVPDQGSLPLVEVRGRTGEQVGPWLPLAETFHGLVDRVAVVDLDRVWDEAELRIRADDEARLGTIQWELLVPAFPDAGRVAREASEQQIPLMPLVLGSELLTIGVVDRAAWGARATGCSSLEDDWYRMAIHHTAGNQTSSGSVLGEVQVLQAYAQDSGEYCDVPYQFLVGYDGTLWEGRELDYLSGATGGGNNDGNIAVCFMGCYHPDSCPNGAGDLVTEEMMDGAQLLVQTLTELHDIPSDADSIRGHRDWPDNATACPGDYVYDRLDELRTDLYWYSAAEVSRSHPAGEPIRLAPGDVVEFSIDLENTGGLAWTPGVTSLGTTEPRDAVSVLSSPRWLDDNRAATVEEEVLPGEIGHFAFEIVGGEPMTTTLSLGLVQEWVTWFADEPWGGGPGDDLVTIEVIVEEPPLEDTGTPPVGEDEDPETTLPPTVAPDNLASDPHRIPLERGGCGCDAGAQSPASLFGLASVALAAMIRRRRWAALLLAVPSVASAVDGWVDIYPGVRYTEDVRPGPINLYIADIDTCASGVSFRATSPTDGTSARVVSNFAQSVGAVLATNGDFYDHDFGLNLGQGIDWAPYISISDGIDDTTNGNFAVGADRIELIPDYLVLPGPEPWMEQVVSGRWTVIDDGVPYYGISDGGFICSPGLRHPRTAIGLSEDGRHVYMLVSDGRGFGGSIGLTCDELIDVMLELGAHNAMGLDGGGSSAMYVDAFGVVNNPSDGHERAVLNHLGVFASGTGAAPHCGERAVAPVAASALGPISTAGAPGRFTAITPRRLFDTRTDSSALISASISADGRAAGGSSFGFASLGLPADARAAWLNITVTEPAGAGFLTVYPGGSPLPTASNLNYAAGEIVANAAIAGLSGQQFDLYTHETTHIIADLQGYIGSQGAGLTPNTPRRLLDTRLTGERLTAGVPLVVDHSLTESAASLTVTIVDPSAPGFLTVYPCDAGLPETSNLNFAAGEVVAAAAMVGTSGGICAWSNVDADLVVDLTGLWTASGGLDIQPVQPLRVLDTRLGTGGWQGRVKPGQVVTMPLSSISGWPTDGEAAILNVTVTDPSSPGYLTIYPCAETPPQTSSINYIPGQTVANLVVTALAADGSVCLLAAGATHVVVDLAAVGVGEPVVLELTPAPPAPPAEEGSASCQTTPGTGGLWSLLVLVCARRRLIL